MSRERDVTDIYQKCYFTGFISCVCACVRACARLCVCVCVCVFFFFCNISNNFMKLLKEPFYSSSYVILI